MGFTSGIFTTNWHSMKIDVAAGCTISFMWFILVVEILLKATYFSVQMVQIQSTKKVLVNDLALLPIDKRIIQNALSRLDGMIKWSRI